MQEQTARLCRWYVITDKGEYTITEKQKDAILKADGVGARFVQIDGAVLNIAFIKEIYRKYETKDLRYSSLSEADKKFLVEEPKKVKQLNATN